MISYPLTQFWGTMRRESSPFAAPRLTSLLKGLVYWKWKRWVQLSHYLELKGYFGQCPVDQYDKFFKSKCVPIPH